MAFIRKACIAVLFIWFCLASNSISNQLITYMKDDIFYYLHVLLSGHGRRLRPPLLLLLLLLLKLYYYFNYFSALLLIEINAIKIIKSSY